MFIQVFEPAFKERDQLFGIGHLVRSETQPQRAQG